MTDKQDVLAEALRIAEAALADIGDADREPGDDLAWCERRAAKALPAVRGALVAYNRHHESARAQPASVAGWVMALAKEIRANAEDHPDETMSRFALHWADMLAARAIAAAPSQPETAQEGEG
jgi:hypothetical protein